MTEPRDNRLSPALPSPAAKIKSVEDQIALMDRGQLKILSCPYCDRENVKGEPLCCNLLMLAVNAVLDSFEAEEQINRAAKIADKASSQIAVERAEDVLARLR